MEPLRIFTVHRLDLKSWMDGSKPGDCVNVILKLLLDDGVMYEWVQTKALINTGAASRGILEL